MIMHQVKFKKYHTFEKPCLVFSIPYPNPLRGTTSSLRPPKMVEKKKLPLRVAKLYGIGNLKLLLEHKFQKIPDCQPKKK